MHGTQVRPNAKGHNERFATSPRTPGAVRGNQKWPLQAGDRIQGSIKRRLLLSKDSNGQSATFDFVTRRSTAIQQFFATFSLERSFTLLSFVVAILVISLFGLDLACGWPFRRAALLFDTTSTISGAMLLLLCWDVFWEQVKRFTH